MNLLHSAKLIFAVVMCAQFSCGQQTFLESKTERDARMRWWREAKFGMFIHWGVYSIPARGEWVMYNEKIPIPEYEKFPNQFNPVKFDAEEWVRIARSAGVRYIVITSKHHDGFCMWDSKVTGYNIADAAPFKRDPLAELAEACRKQGVRLGFYYSIMDWHNPLAHGESFARYRDEYMIPQLKELITRYHPAVLWFDGQWIPEWDEEQGQCLYAELRGLDPSLIMNNRVGKGRNDLLSAHTGQAMVGDFATPEQYIPEDELTSLDWETCMTMNDNWGYAAKDTNWKPVKSLVRNLVDIASKGGNFLLNVGPTSEGEIPAECTKRLAEVGRWLKVNGDAVFGTAGSPFESTPWGRCTMKSTPDHGMRLFLEVFNWPKDGALAVPGLASEPEKVSLLANPPKPLTSRREVDMLRVLLPLIPPDTLSPVVTLDFPGEVLTYHRPKIIAPSPIFLERMELALSVPSELLEIRYTLNGDGPTLSSHRYSAPIVITENTRVQAVTFYQGRAVSAIVRREFMKVTPRPADKASRLVPGLAYQYFEGEWSKLPHFDSLRPVASGISPTVGIEVRQRSEKYGLRFTGYLTVPEDAVYLLALNSDDGSRLYFGKDLIIDNDGLHSAVTKQGYIALAKGAHAIIIDYFNNLWEGEMGLRIAVEGRALKPVSAGQLGHSQ